MKEETRVRIKWSYKIAAFLASVVSLSWFFAGWRQIHESATLLSWMIFLGAIMLTSLLICLQAYWIYFEEKAKGTLRKRIELFEKINTTIAGSSEKLIWEGEKGEPTTHE